MLNRSQLIEIREVVPLPKLRRFPHTYDPFESALAEGSTLHALDEKVRPWWVVLGAWIAFGLPSIVIPLMIFTAANDDVDVISLGYILLFSFPALLTFVALGKMTWKRIRGRREQVV